MQKKSSQTLDTSVDANSKSTDTPKNQQNRIPSTHEGIQINFCKNPNCDNFGKTDEGVDASAKSPAQNRYTAVSAGKNYPYLRCNSCHEHFPVKSNAGVFEETQRIREYLTPKADICCPNEDCSNHFIPVSAGKAYYSSFGKTEIGSPRWKCKAVGCGKTFSVPKTSTHGQHKSHKNKIIFQLLINKMPMRRICEVAEIGPKSLYDKIDFIHKQCLDFIASRESKLPELHINRVYLGVDRQDYVANWTCRSDRRNIAFTAVASSDNKTGYCFGMHLNFDPSLNRIKIEEDAKAVADETKPQPFRKYARHWLDFEYEAAVLRSPKKVATGSLKKQIEQVYNEAVLRDDIENLDTLTTDERLPEQGMQIHSEYTLYAHFMHLKSLLAHVEKIRFFLDQDSAMRAACLGAFAKEIKEDRKVDVFFVSISKNLTVDQKRRKTADAKAEIDLFRAQNRDMSESDAILEMIKSRLASMSEIGKWKDRWLSHPMPDMSEPEKAVCYLTDFEDYDTNHLAWLYNKASLHAVDTHFMQIRRRIAPLERAIHSQSNAGSVWNGYAPYNPKQIQKLLDIFRLAHNFILPRENAREKSKKDEDGNKIIQTPATLLGLAKGVVSYEDILYFHRNLPMGLDEGKDE